MALNAGNLRDKVKLLRATTTTAPNGEIIEKWSVYAQVRCQVIQQKSSKAFTNGEQWYPTARTLVMRIPPHVKGGDRVELHGETYVALPPKIFSREGYQEVDCEQLNL